jgi:hypothetical protein
MQKTFQHVLILFVAAAAVMPHRSAGDRRVNFPPADSKPPPSMKAPPKTESSGEDTGIIPGWGPAMRKTQQRSPPPPTNLTVIYKVKYGTALEYVHPDGRVEQFEQWRSYADDGANLMRLVNNKLSDGNNYQYATKPLSSPGFDPADIPLLFMAGDYDFVLQPEEVRNLRVFLTGGGTILFNAARGRDEFSRAVVREMRKVFPNKAMMRASLDHPIFNARFRLRKVMTMDNGGRFMRPPLVYTMDIGTRGAAILVPDGMGAAWSNASYHVGGKHVMSESAVRLGVNIVAYVLAGTEYGRFLAQEFPLYDGSTSEGDTVRFALANYHGSWDVNPAIQNSVLQALTDNTNIDVDYQPEIVALDDPAMAEFPIVFMTGHYNFVLNKAEMENITRYLRRGGLIVASAAAGLKPFDAAFRRELDRVLPNNPLIKLPPTHPIFSGGWNPINSVTYTPAALRDQPDLQFPEFYGVFINNRLAIIYTPYDLMSGVNRESNAYAKGVSNSDATRLVVNLIVYALSN